ncbi:MAG TPA: hypothetical protein VGO62_07275, partial [Myxococcota bacterium]
SSTCGPYEERCGATCTAVTIDPDHCGGCETICSDAQVCAGGACVDAAGGCLGNTVPCGRACVDTDSDNANCGGCGAPCSGTQGCAAGACVDTVPLTPVGSCDGDIVVPGGAGGSNVCTGDLAQVSFTFGLCSCDQVGVSSPIQIDGFDSLTGPYVAGGGGGALGANGQVATSALIDVTGTLWSASTSGLQVSAPVNAGGELHVNGAIASNSSVAVTDDAFVNGTIVAGGGMSVGGTLFVPSGTDTSAVTAGSVQQGTVAVPPPCACDAGDIVPVAAIVESIRANNDDALVGLDPAVLSHTDAPSRIDLECGSYFFDDVSTSKAITIVAHGKVAIAIGGDIGTSAPLVFAVDPSGELDVFVEGTIGTSSRVSFGSPAFPALTRVYVGDPNGIGLSSSLDVGGFLYVVGRVGTSGDKEIFGGLFAGEYNSSGATTIHYDTAILDAGNTCTGHGIGDEGEGEGAGEGEGEGACTSCRDCGNQACVDGTCGACSTSADCCSPLICADGTCLFVGG